MTLAGKKAELATLLIKLGAIEFGAFKLKIHRIPGNEHLPLSPIYLNLRTANHPVNPGKLTPEAMDLIGALFLELLRESDIYAFECIADIPDAGDPFGEQATIAARTLGLGTTRVGLQKTKMADGTTLIEMKPDEPRGNGATCILVDDLITGADTKLEAIAALESGGYEVWDILAVVDRLQGGTQKLDAEGRFVYTIFKLDELLDFYVEQGMLGEMKAEEIMAYIRTNQVH